MIEQSAPLNRIPTGDGRTARAARLDVVYRHFIDVHPNRNGVQIRITFGEPLDCETGVEDLSLCSFALAKRCIRTLALAWVLGGKGVHLRVPRAGGPVFTTDRPDIAIRRRREMYGVQPSA